VNPILPNTDAELGRLKAMPQHRKATIMRRKCFCEEQVFGFIWDSADADGLWDGDASTVAAEFGVSEDEAHDVLGELCDGHHVEKLVPGKYAIVKWRERDDPSGEEVGW
jgi:hypothetical protein